MRVSISVLKAQALWVCCPGCADLPIGTGRCSLKSAARPDCLLDHPAQMDGAIPAQSHLPAGPSVLAAAGDAAASAPKVSCISCCLESTTDTLAGAMCNLVALSCRRRQVTHMPSQNGSLYPVTCTGQLACLPQCPVWTERFNHRFLARPLVLLQSVVVASQHSLLYLATAAQRDSCVRQ